MFAMKEKISSLREKVLLLNTFVFFIFSLFALSLSFASCSAKKAIDSATQGSSPSPESRPEDLTETQRFLYLKLNDGTYHDIMGNGGLGAFTVPDAHEMPPSIMAPDPIFKARPEGHSSKSKQ